MVKCIAFDEDEIRWIKQLKALLKITSDCQVVRTALRELAEKNLTKTLHICSKEVKK